MPASVELHPAAAAEIDGAYEWYLDRSPIAARAFLTELSAGIEQIAVSPLQWPAYLGGTRRYVFPKFPFCLVYRIQSRTLTVIAVAHQRRNPGYWKQRH